MGWADQLTKRQVITSALWLCVGLALIAAVAWAAHCDAVAYEAKNPEHRKSGWNPNPSYLATGLSLCGIFGAGAAIGAAIGELTRYRLACSVAGIFIFPIAAIVVANLIR